MGVELVNPLDETPRPLRAPAPRLATLRDKTIGLLDISKSGGSAYLDRIRELLEERFAVGRIVRETKPTFARPAPRALIDRLVGEDCAAVIEALAD